MNKLDTRSLILEKPPIENTVANRKIILALYRNGFGVRGKAVYVKDYLLIDNLEVDWLWMKSHKEIFPRGTNIGQKKSQIILGWIDLVEHDYPELLEPKNPEQDNSKIKEIVPDEKRRLGWEVNFFGWVISFKKAGK